MSNSSIAKNRSAKFDYQISDTYQAGIKLEGWEVKSLREGKANIKESYVYVKHGEVFISGMQITPLISASTHKEVNPTRIRKLLMNKSEINKLIGLVERESYTLVPIELYWCKQYAKLRIGIGKGKKLHDKRESKKQSDWKRTQSRILKQSVA